MKALRLVFVLLALAVVAAPVWWYISADPFEREFDEDEPDVSSTSVRIDKQEYLRLRNEQIDLLRGFDTATQDSRTKALREMERDEAALRDSTEGTPAASWRFLGPAPIPVNAATSYSGRVSAIAVHPTNPNIVYVGTAYGGLYRSLNGGTTWTPIMDSAFSLAIGSITLAPSDPTILFVGTGEATFSGLSCSGVGVYRISNADTTPVLSGPLNQGSAGGDVFTGRSIGRVIVHPTDPNIIFVTSASGISGIGGTNNGLVLPNAGVYRSLNAMSAAPTFTQLTIQGTLGASRSVVDAATEPGNPARLIVSVIGSGGDGGVYLSTNALDAVPTFVRNLTTGDGATPGRTEFAVNKTGAVVTVYAATGTANGTVYKSVDGGATFNPLAAGVGFCNPQCFYDIAIAVDQTDANKLYLGGAPTRVFARSIDGGGSYVNSSANLHVDTHAFAIAPSDPNTVYFGSDGGIWKTTNVQATPIVWQSLNNTTFSATQFMGIALHPFNRYYSLGGTQDNGTEFLAPDGTTWVRSDGGDGGFAVIDRNSPTVNNVTAYHTYFNQTTNQIGFTRALTTDTNGDPIWSGFLGCQNGSTNNGIICSDTVRFYAPMVGGPGSPNDTLYFGTNRLYRSVDRGTTMTDLTGLLPATVTAIAVAPQDDNIRLAGLQNGNVILVNGSTITNITGPIPNRYVGRVAIDPTNVNTAYVSLNGYGLPSGQHVWKTTNLLAASPTWTATGPGIPDVPVNSFAIDAGKPQTIFAGTDIGVFRSDNGGTSWQPFNSGLPRVPVFGMEFQPLHRVLRVATHGRGFYEYSFGNQRAPFDFDGDGKTDIGIFRPIAGASEWWINRSSNGQTFALQFGTSTDKITPADFTGDGKSDIAFFRPGSGEWYVLRSEDFSFFAVPFGTNGDIPAPGDFDADGKADFVVFRPSSGTWFVGQSSNGGTQIVQFGIPGDQPVVADYDGDSKADVAIYRATGSGLGEWWIQRSTAGLLALQFGANSDRTVQGDYTGDGKADIAVFTESTGQWLIVRSEDFSFFGFPFGGTGDLPSPGDYDGDGKFDPTIFRPSSAIWFIAKSTAGLQIVPFGTNGDKPIANAFVR